MSQPEDVHFDKKRFNSSFAVDSKSKLNVKRVKKDKNGVDVSGGDTVREFSSKTPFIRDVTDQLFSASKTGTNFHQRSKSVLSPTAVSAYTPVAKQTISGL